MKTVKELREFLKDLPDDMLLVKFHKDMETSGYSNFLCCEVIPMKKETKQTWDRFDGTDYAYEVFEVSEKEGTPCLRII